MENNKTLILVLLVAGLAVIAGIFIVVQPGSVNVATVVLALAAGAVGWYAGSSGKSADETANKSIVDELTGLHTYNYFIDRLNEERKRADRFGSRVSMILVDIDNFKAFNDQHGTQLGKDLIKHIGEIVKIQVRGVDIVSRYNDIQFGVLLPNTGHVAALDVAERIREAVETGDFDAQNKAGKRTVSAGLATYPDSAGDDVQLIERVDEALGQAKTEKNRVVVFESDNSEQRAAT